MTSDAVVFLIHRAGKKSVTVFYGCIVGEYVLCFILWLKCLKLAMFTLSDNIQVDLDLELSLPTKTGKARDSCRYSKSANYYNIL